MKRYNWPKLTEVNGNKIITQKNQKTGLQLRNLGSFSCIENLQISLCQSAQSTSLKISMINSIEWCMVCTVRNPN